jgi:diguanylate cyclase (GGDEF)-like protein
MISDWQRKATHMMLLDPRRAQLEEELKGLREILSVAQVVVSSLELGEVLQDLLFSAMAVMDMPAGSIALYDHPRRELSLHAHAGLSPSFVALDRWQVQPDGLSRRILDAGEPFIIENVHNAGPLPLPLQREGICSLIAVPLKVQDKIVGILYLDDFVPQRFAESRMRLLSILASFAAMSIDNARLHQEMSELACTDGLTGLYNHRHFKVRAAEELAIADRYQRPLTLVMFDIDDFKKFNDTYGHPVGDQALGEVAGILRRSVRECDQVFRYGGEEFMVLLPETSLNEGLAAAERSRRLVERESRRLLRGAKARGVTVSAGVASFPCDGGNLEALLHVVDQLLYLAKEKGKNMVHHRPFHGEAGKD